MSRSSQLPVRSRKKSIDERIGEEQWNQFGFSSLDAVEYNNQERSYVITLGGHGQVSLRPSKCSESCHYFDGATLRGTGSSPELAKARLLNDIYLSGQDHHREHEEHYNTSISRFSLNVKDALTARDLVKREAYEQLGRYQLGQPYKKKDKFYVTMTSLSWLCNCSSVNQVNQLSGCGETDKSAYMDLLLELYKQGARHHRAHRKAYEEKKRNLDAEIQDMKEAAMREAQARAAAAASAQQPPVSFPPATSTSKDTRGSKKKDTKKRR